MIEIYDIFYGDNSTESKDTKLNDIISVDLSVPIEPKSTDDESPSFEIGDSSKIKLDSSDENNESKIELGDLSNIDKSFDITNLALNSEEAGKELADLVVDLIKPAIETAVKTAETYIKNNNDDTSIPVDLVPRDSSRGIESTEDSLYTPQGSSDESLVDTELLGIDSESIDTPTVAVVTEGDIGNTTTESVINSISDQVETDVKAIIISAMTEYARSTSPEQVAALVSTIELVTQNNIASQQFYEGVSSKVSDLVKIGPIRKIDIDNGRLQDYLDINQDEYLHNIAIKGFTDLINSVADATIRSLNSTASEIHNSIGIILDDLDIFTPTYRALYDASDMVVTDLGNTLVEAVHQVEGFVNGLASAYDRVIRAATVDAVAAGSRWVKENVIGKIDEYKNDLLDSVNTFRDDLINELPWNRPGTLPPWVELSSYTTYLGWLYVKHISYFVNNSLTDVSYPIASEDEYRLNHMNQGSEYIYHWDDPVTPYGASYDQWRRNLLKSKDGQKYVSPDSSEEIKLESDTDEDLSGLRSSQSLLKNHWNYLRNIRDNTNKNNPIYRFVTSFDWLINISPNSFKGSAPPSLTSIMGFDELNRMYRQGSPGFYLPITSYSLTEAGLDSLSFSFLSNNISIPQNYKRPSRLIITLPDIYAYNTTNTNKGYKRSVIRTFKEEYMKYLKTPRGSEDKIYSLVSRDYRECCYCITVYRFPYTYEADKSKTLEMYSYKTYLGIPNILISESGNDNKNIVMETLEFDIVGEL